MYRNAISQQCVTETNTVSWVNYTFKTNRLTHTKRDQNCGYQEGWRRGNWMKGVKNTPSTYLCQSSYLPVIRQISIRDEMHNVIHIISTAVYSSVGFPGFSVIKNLPAMQEMQETRLRSPGQEDPLEEGMTTQSSNLAWRIPQTEEAGG